MNSLMPKKSEILQRFEIDKKTSFFSIKEMALVASAVRTLKCGLWKRKAGSKTITSIKHENSNVDFKNIEVKWSKNKNFDIKNIEIQKC